MRFSPSPISSRSRELFDGMTHSACPGGVCSKRAYSLLRSSLVSRRATTKGRVMESAGTSVKKQFRPGQLESSTSERTGWWPNKAQTYWPRLEGLAPWFLRNANCQDTYELLNNKFLTANRGWAASVRVTFRAAEARRFGCRSRLPRLHTLPSSRSVPLS